MSELNAENFNVDDESVDAKALAAAGSRFCELWPSVKEGLELLKTIIKKPVLRFAINALIKFGDKQCD